MKQKHNLLNNFSYKLIALLIAIVLWLIAKSEYLQNLNK